MNPKKKAIAKNVNIQDLLRALSQLNVENIDIEIHQFDDMPNKLIIKPIYKDDEEDIPEDLDSSVSDDNNDDIQDNNDVKDLLDLI